MFKWFIRTFWTDDRIEAEILLFLVEHQNSSGAMISNGLKISSGKLYPALLRLEVRGFISS